MVTLAAGRETAAQKVAISAARISDTKLIRPFDLSVFSVILVSQAGPFRAIRALVRHFDGHCSLRAGERNAYPGDDILSTL